MFERSKGLPAAILLAAVTLMPGIATPVTYEVNGKQFVAVMSGTANGRVFGFALDATGRKGD